MRDYGKVHTTFWTSGTVGSLSEDGRLLALYLLTSPHSTIAGVFRLPDGYVMEDLKWCAERVRKGFQELFDKGFANRCETTKWVHVLKHLEWNPPENPNQRKSAKKIALSVPDNCRWKLDFMRVWGQSLGISEEDFPNPPETLSEPLLNQEQEQEQDNCSEQQGFELLPIEAIVPPDPPVAELPLVDGTSHPVRREEAEAWSRAYPAVNVPAELLRMGAWLEANRRKRKTARGINAFIVAWLTRTQDSPRRGTGTDGAVDEHGVPL